MKNDIIKLNRQKSSEHKRSGTMKLIEFLQENGVNQKLVDDAVYFRDYYKVDENYRDRIPRNLTFFLWERCLGNVHRGTAGGAKHIDLRA
jgi:hypothetical protein